MSQRDDRNQRPKGFGAQKGKNNNPGEGVRPRSLNAYFLALENARLENAISVVTLIRPAPKDLIVTFSSSVDAQEFLAAQDLLGRGIVEKTFDTPELLETTLTRMAQYGVEMVTVNPPPLLDGLFRIMRFEQVITWSRTGSPAGQTLLSYFEQLVETETDPSGARTLQAEGQKWRRKPDERAKSGE